MATEMPTAHDPLTTEKLASEVRELARVMHNFGHFHHAAGRDPHKALEHVRVRLGDKDFSEHLAKRWEREAAEQDAAAKERAARASADEKVAAMERKVEELVAQNAKLIALLTAQQGQGPKS